MTGHIRQRSPGHGRPLARARVDGGKSALARVRARVLQQRRLFCHAQTLELATMSSVAALAATLAKPIAKLACRRVIVSIAELGMANRRR